MARAEAAAPRLRGVALVSRDRRTRLGGTCARGYMHRHTMQVHTHARVHAHAHVTMHVSCAHASMSMYAARTSASDLPPICSPYGARSAARTSSLSAAMKSGAGPNMPAPAAPSPPSHGRIGSGAARYGLAAPGEPTPAARTRGPSTPRAWCCCQPRSTSIADGSRAASRRARPSRACAAASRCVGSGGSLPRSTRGKKFVPPPRPLPACSSHPLRPRPPLPLRPRPLPAAL
eukprot:scaffold58041_cov75-Phaeocystis_antarctica.AAC.2